MPKGGSGNEDRAKVKLRVIEFELEGGNASVENSIRQLTHALTTNRNGAPANRVPAGKPQRELPGENAPSDDADEIVQDAEVVDGHDEAAQDTPAPKSQKSKNTYKPRVPQYLPNLDLTGNGTTFKDFAAQKNPSKSTQRHLVAAYWLKEHGNCPTINIDKVYTCYRTAGWPMTQKDWDVNFRQQVQNDRFQRVSTGEYSITPIGENDVRTMDGTQ